MKKCLPVILLLLSGSLHSQNPLVKQWDARFGGAAEEYLYFLNNTSDKGFLLGGTTTSDSTGDMMHHSKGYFDFWLVKTDSSGTLEWERNYGGSDQEYLYSARELPDKGYLLFGPSESGIDGDKTVANYDTSQLTADVWILRIDSAGNKIWDKRLGSYNHDVVLTSCFTLDGNILLGCSSSSDSGGDKSQNSQMLSEDYWIVKIDTLGNKIWDKTYGGTGLDELNAVKQTNDGGFILGGYSNSDSTGDMTQHSRGALDYWIVKTDSAGNKLWDRRFGGTSYDYLIDLVLTSDNGFLLRGWSRSDSSGDKTQNAYNPFYFDYWIVKVDSAGNKLWDKTFGGIYDDGGYGNLLPCADGGFLVCGTSGSPAGFDKSENNLGGLQMWIVKIDSAGNKAWDKTIMTGNPGNDLACFSVATDDGGYVFADYHNAGIAGECTFPMQGTGGPDLWMIKYLDSTITTGIYPAAINDPVSAVTVYPNPFDSRFNLALATVEKPNGPALIILKNIYGQDVFSLNINLPLINNPISIDPGNLAGGIYFLEIVFDNQHFVKKIIRE